MKVFDQLAARFRKNLPIPVPASNPWRPAEQSTLPETPREKFLRERSHRRKAANRTRNAVAKQSRKVNR